MDSLSLNGRLCYAKVTPPRVQIYLKRHGEALFRPRYRSPSQSLLESSSAEIFKPSLWRHSPSNISSALRSGAMMQSWSSSPAVFRAFRIW